MSSKTLHVVLQSQIHKKLLMIKSVLKFTNLSDTISELINRFELKEELINEQ